MSFVKVGKLLLVFFRFQPIDINFQNYIRKKVTGRNIGHKFLHFKERIDFFEVQTINITLNLKLLQSKVSEEENNSSILSPIETYIKILISLV